MIVRSRRTIPARSPALWPFAIAASLAAVPVAEARQRKKPPVAEPTSPPPPVDPMEAENSPTPPPPPPPPPPQQGGSGGSSSGSSAQSSSNNAGSQPPPSPTEKVGRFMANLRIGAAPCLYNSFNNCSHQGALGIEIGASILANKNGYLILPLQFQFAPNGSSVMVPLGFQYDIALPWAGLYIYPRVSLGYALLIDSMTPGSPTVHAGVFIPELGLKYVWRGRWNFGGELVSLPMVFGQSSSGTFGYIYYRVMLAAGVNF